MASPLSAAPDLSEHNIQTFTIPTGPSSSADEVSQAATSAPEPTSGAAPVGGGYSANKNDPQSFTSESSAQALQIHIVEPRGVKSDNLPLSTWASSLVLASNLWKLDLARHLVSIPEPPSPSAPLHPILEIGAGTGLVGITAAAQLGAAYATLSDLPGIVPGVAANVAVNAELLIERGCVVRAAALDWRSPRALAYPFAGANSILPRRLDRKSTKARLMFAADTVYDPLHPVLLERMVHAWLERGPEARFVICYPLRVAYLDYVRELWERLETLGLVADKEGRQEGSQATNGDDELLCEFVSWRWTSEALKRGIADPSEDTWDAPSREEEEEEEEGGKEEFTTATAGDVTPKAKTTVAPPTRSSSSTSASSWASAATVATASSETTPPTGDELAAKLEHLDLKQKEDKEQARR